MAAEIKNHQYSVNILDVCRVAPHSSSSSSSPKSLPLTFFDIMILRFPPVPRLFLYQTQTTSSFFNTIIVPKLKHSLSLVLQHYLPLSGNLIWPQHSPKPIIQFLEGDSVSFTVAESDDADFHHLSSDGFRQVSVYYPLVPELPVSDHRIASTAFQITRIQNSGFCIGITSHHAILDGTSLFPFIKSWAQICNNLRANSSSIDSMPFYERTTIKDPEGLEAIYLNAWQNMDGPNNKDRSISPFPHIVQPDLIRCTLELNGQTLKKLKQWVLNKREKNEGKHQKSVHLSSFTVACAYLWVCVAKSESLRDKKMVLTFPVNARSRLEPPLPSNYFGNCIIFRCCCVDGNEVLGDENGMMVAVDAISEEIKLLEQGVFKGALNLLSSLSSDNIEEHRRTFIAGSPRFEVYDIDFGWGKPTKVEVSIYLGPGIFHLSDSRNGDGGIHIGLAGKINEMESFTSLFAQGLEAI